MNSCRKGRLVFVTFKHRNVYVHTEGRNIERECAISCPMLMLRPQKRKTEKRVSCHAGCVRPQPPYTSFTRRCSDACASVGVASVDPASLLVVAGSLGCSPCPGVSGNNDQPAGKTRPSGTRGSPADRAGYCGDDTYWRTFEEFGEGAKLALERGLVEEQGTE